MIVQTGNSAYQLSGIGSRFEVRKLSDNLGAVVTGVAMYGDHFDLRVGESFMLFDAGKRVLTTSSVIAVLG